MDTHKRTGIPKVTRRETDWGLETLAIFPGGSVSTFQFRMPATVLLRLPAPEPDVAWDDRLQWTVPIDDEHTQEFVLRVLPVKTGDIARRYEDQGTEFLAPVPELGELFLKGKLSHKDLGEATNGNKFLLNIVQDYVVMVGQGTISDRKQMHLGQSDRGVILFRKIWERELRALAERRPLKQWRNTEDMPPRLER
jgi:hypothetical protein